ncbi:MAG: PQQ-binding-like beta-propeller repeat protein [Oscillospiraceae bacterium]
MAVFSSAISSSNVQELTLKWQAKTRSYITSQPLSYSNNILVCDWQGYIYCFDSESGNLIYDKQLYQPPKQDGVFRKIPVLNKVLGEPLPYLWNGFAGSSCISGGIWFIASVGGKEGTMLTNGSAGRLYAVYASSGEILWESALSEQIYSGSLAVPVCDDYHIYVGLCSVDEVASVAYKLKLKSFQPECTGEIFCFEKFTGRKIWRKKTVDLIIDDNPQAKGAGIWGGFSIPTSNSLVFSTGNSYGQPASKASDSVLSISKIDGRLQWCFQAVANDAWMPLKPDGRDYDFGCTPLPFKCSKASSNVAIGAGNKNGFLYAIDSITGKLVWNTFCHFKSTPDDGIRSNITFDDGKIYVWSKNKKPRNSMCVNCIDADTGKVLWCVNRDGTNAMTTGAVTNDLYFLANYSGDIYALNKDSGEEAWLTRIKKGAFGSDIAIYNNRIFAGLGVPKMYGGSTAVCGVACYGFKP